MSKKHSHKSTYYNDIALRLANNLFGVKHLHYGFFSDGLEPTVENLPEAQERYMKNLLSYIPVDVKKVFDVGCGTGEVAKQLIKKGMELTCLAPDPHLIQKTKENTEGKAKTITDLYENVDDEEDESFDMVMMSESCQYISIQKGWEQNRKYLKKGGYVLIADFFQIKPLDKEGLSKSGHKKERFLKVAKDSGFELLKEVDITKETAPTMDIYQDVITQKVFPVAEAIFEVLERKLPTVYKILKKTAGKKIEKLKNKYLTQDAKTFQTYKGYYIFLFQKI